MTYGLALRRRFLIRVHGGNVLLATEEGNARYARFLATRVVWADGEDQAREAALTRIRADLAERDIASESLDALALTAEDVHEIPWWKWRFRKPDGFTFYTWDEGESKGEN